MSECVCLDLWTGVGSLLIIASGNRQLLCWLQSPVLKDNSLVEFSIACVCARAHYKV